MGEVTLVFRLRCLIFINNLFIRRGGIKRKVMKVVWRKRWFSIVLGDSSML